MREKKVEQARIDVAVREVEAAREQQANLARRHLMAEFGRVSPEPNEEPIEVQPLAVRRGRNGVLYAERPRRSEDSPVHVAWG